MRAFVGMGSSLAWERRGACARADAPGAPSLSRCAPPRLLFVVYAQPHEEPHAGMFEERQRRPFVLRGLARSIVLYRVYCAASGRLRHERSAGSRGSFSRGCRAMIAGRWCTI